MVRIRSDDWTVECGDMMGKVWWFVQIMPSNRIALQNRNIQRDIRVNPVTSVQQEYLFTHLKDGRY